MPMVERLPTLFLVVLGTVTARISALPATDASTMKCNTDELVGDGWIESVCPDDQHGLLSASSIQRVVIHENSSWSLDLSLCNLKLTPDLSNHTLCDSSLLSLNLSHNHIRSFKSNSFISLSNLTYLDISNNLDCYDSETMPPGVFNGLNALRALFIQLKHIRDGCDNKFHIDSTSLRSLKLSLSQLFVTGTYRPMVGIDQLTELRILSLGGNNCHLSPSTFGQNSTYSRVERLSIRNCSYVLIPLDLEKLFPSLIYIDMSCSPNLDLIEVFKFPKSVRVLLLDGPIPNLGCKSSCPNVFTSSNITAFSFRYHLTTFKTQRTKINISGSPLKWLSYGYDVIGQSYREYIKNHYNLLYLDFTYITVTETVSDGCQPSHPWFLSSDSSLLQDYSSQIRNTPSQPPVYPFLPNLTTFIAARNVFLPFPTDKKVGNNSLEFLDISRYKPNADKECPEKPLGLDRLQLLKCQNCELRHRTHSLVSLSCLTWLFPNVVTIDLSWSRNVKLHPFEKFNTANRMKVLNLSNLETSLVSSNEESYDKTLSVNFTRLFPHLSTLDLSYNKLESIDVSIPLSLQHLNLQGNRIKNISDRFMAELSHLNTIKSFSCQIGISQDLCSCHVQYCSLLTWLHNSSFITLDPPCLNVSRECCVNPVHTTPTNYEPSAELIGGAATGSVLVIATFIVAFILYKRKYWAIRIWLYRLPGRIGGLCRKPESYGEELRNFKRFQCYMVYNVDVDEQEELAYKIQEIVRNSDDVEFQILSRFDILIGQVTNSRVIDMLLASTHAIILIPDNSFFESDISMFDFHVALELLSTERVFPITNPDQSFVDLTSPLVSQVMTDNAKTIYPSSSDDHDVSVFLSNLTSCLFQSVTTI